MGTIVPDGQAQYAQAESYKPDDLQNQADTKAVQPGGVAVARDTLIREAYNAPQRNERGSDATIAGSIAADIEAHTPRLGLPNEALADKADFTQAAITLFGLEVQEKAVERSEDEYSTQITEDELNLERPLKDERTL